MLTWWEWLSTCKLELPSRMLREQLSSCDLEENVINRIMKLKSNRRIRIYKARMLPEMNLFQQYSLLQFFSSLIASQPNL
jgi:hypothetical protein